MNEFNLSEKAIEIVRINTKLHYYHSKHIKEFIEKLKEEVDEYRKKKFQMHNVDECGCCEKNLNNIYKILEKIDKLVGDKLTSYNRTNGK